MIASEGTSKLAETASQEADSPALRFPPTEDEEASLRTQRQSAASPSAPASPSKPTPVKRKRGRPRGSKAASNWSRISKEDLTSSDSEDEMMHSAADKGKGRATGDDGIADVSAGLGSQVEGRTTKSGRKVKPPTTFTPDTAPTFARKPVRKAPRPPSPIAARTSPGGCILCSLASWTASNQLVYCDGCDKPFHQQCHEPNIGEDVLVNEQSLWFCAGCTNGHASRVTTPRWEEAVPGQSFSAVDKSEYLQSLPRRALLRMLQMVSERYPEVRLYPPDLPDLVQAQRANLSSMAGQTMETGQQEADVQQASSRMGQQSASQVKMPSLSSKALLEAAKPAKTQAAASNVLSYEDMIVHALKYINESKGSPPRMIFEYMNDTYPLLDNFRPSAHQALQKGIQRGRLLKENNLYKLNPNFDEKAPRRRARKPKRGTQPPENIPQHVARRKPPSAYATPLDALTVRRARVSRSATLSEVDQPNTPDDTDMLDEELPSVDSTVSKTAKRRAAPIAEIEELGDEQDYQLEGDVEGENDEDEELDEIDGDLAEAGLPSESQEGMDAMLADLFRHSAQSANPPYPAQQIQGTSVYQTFTQYHSTPQQSLGGQNHFQQFLKAQAGTPGLYGSLAGSADASVDYHFSAGITQAQTVQFDPQAYEVQPVRSHVDPALR